MRLTQPQYDLLKQLAAPVKRGQRKPYIVREFFNYYLHSHELDTPVRLNRMTMNNLRKHGYIDTHSIFKPMKITNEGIKAVEDYEAKSCNLR